MNDDKKARVLGVNNVIKSKYAALEEYKGVLEIRNARPRAPPSCGC